MRRYRFRLEPVLRVRCIEAQTARTELFAAAAAVAGAEHQLNASVERYRNLPQPAAAEGVPAWLARRAAAERAATTVAAAGALLQSAEGRLDESRRSLAEARMRVTALERLDERRRAEHTLEVRKSEDADLDELVTTRQGTGR